MGEAGWPILAPSVLDLLHNPHNYEAVTAGLFLAAALGRYSADAAATQSVGTIAVAVLPT